MPKYLAIGRYTSDGLTGGAPSVMAALAGFVHDRESTANDERNDDNDAY